MIPIKIIYLTKKQKPKIFQYRNYKTFNKELFRIELNKELSKIYLNNTELTEFHNVFLPVLNKHALIKYKNIRANNSSYMTKRNYSSYKTMNERKYALF